MSSTVANAGGSSPRNPDEARGGGASRAGFVRVGSGIPADAGGPSDLDRYWRPRDWLASLGLTLATLAAYAPVRHAGFVWDDDAHVTAPVLRSFAGLWRIWSQPGATQQYYPVLCSAFWLEHRLWGDGALGYHLLNVLLHAAAACLLYRVLRRLAVPGALLGAALFALHPVEVESVAWISEQKNTLSAVFALAAALAYFRFERSRRLRWYGFALGWFVLALLSKTVTATLPAALLVVAWWKRGRLSWRTDMLPLGPWLVLGAGAGAMTAWVERTFVGARGPAFRMSWTDRFLVAGHAPWFYLGKLLWPVRLTFIYPRWKIAAGDPVQYVWPALAVGALAAAWSWRRRSRAPLAAALLYAGILFPALGFVEVFPFLYSFVADHFQYLASAALLPALAAGIALGLSRLKPGMRTAGWAAMAGLVAALAAMTSRQCAMYADAQTLWRTTIARNPGCWMAYNNLASGLLDAGRTDEALADIRTSLKLYPENSAARANLGDLYQREGRLDEALTQYAKALELDPDNIVAHNNLGNALARLGRMDQAVAQYRMALAVRPDYALAHTSLGDAYLKMGRLDPAIAQFRWAIRDDPGDTGTHSNLGTALMRKGRVEEATEQFQAALDINPRYVPGLVNRGNAELQAGRVDAAISSYLAALAIDPNSLAANGNLAFSLLRAGRVREAISHFRRVMEIDPSASNDDSGYRQLREGHVAEAIAYFQAALGMDPNSPVARKNLREALSGQ